MTITLPAPAVCACGCGKAHGTDPGGAARKTLRKALHAYAGGVCFSCGQATVLDIRDSLHDGDDLAQIGHVNTACGGSKAVAPGNVGNQCVTCNTYAKRTPNLYALLPRMVRPDVIPAQWEAGWTRREAPRATSAYAATAAKVWG